MNGAARYVLDERVDNEWGSLCFYQNVNMTNTGNTVDTWRLNGYRIADDVKVVDTTNPSHNALDVDDAWQWVENHGEEIAFTVNPVTERVDVIYLVNDGWDAKVTISLSDKLADAGWEIVSSTGNVSADKASVVYNDNAAEALYGKEYTLTIYNENLKNVTASSTTYSVTVVKGGATITTSALNAGKLTIKWNITGDTATGLKDINYVVDGLSLGTITVDPTSTYKIANDVDGKYDVILGQGIDIELVSSSNQAFKGPTVADNCPLSHWHWECTMDATKGSVNIDVDDGKVSADLHEISFTFYPWHNNSETYTITGAAWVHNDNVVDA